ncbi:expressed unknown protein [Seminavis robusta]|uniref:Cyclic nucleotide-binding domain-containing protein n=1 Tax=Seminavis robusta TaxID=568900 RepID=A0A9N8DAK3_9STRA|nr:expressed unknown protein [Seminavis robusta]|eukprot:Sro16_g012000.1 n/a (337) ;mRNA; r:185194-186204
MVLANIMNPSRYTTMRLTLFMGLCLAQADAFTVMPSSATRLSRPFGALPMKTTATPTSSLSLFPMSISSELSSFSSELLSNEDLVQDEFMNGMTHALLDFTTLWGATTVVIRLATVIGRIFILAQDLDHDVLPDELAFQIFLFAVACHGLITASLPKIQAHLEVPHLMTFPDRQAFRSIFRPAGISWSQYKELHLSSMDWVTVEPGQVILANEEEQDAVYWLYQGNVSVQGNTSTHNVCSQNHAPGLRLLGEKRLAMLLDSRQRRAETKTTKSSSQVAAVAGEHGAKLLRMNTTKLEKHLKRDPDLNSSLSRLAFQGMQDKLDALLWKEATNELSG